MSEQRLIKREISVLQTRTVEGEILTFPGWVPDVMLDGAPANYLRKMSNFIKQVDNDLSRIVKEHNK